MALLHIGGCLWLLFLSYCYSFSFAINAFFHFVPILCAKLCTITTSPFVCLQTDSFQVSATCRKPLMIWVAR